MTLEPIAERDHEGTLRCRSCGRTVGHSALRDTKGIGCTCWPHEVSAKVEAERRRVDMKAILADPKARAEMTRRAVSFIVAVEDGERERTSCFRCEEDFHRNNPPGCELCGTCERCGCLDGFPPNEAHMKEVI